MNCRRCKTGVLEKFYEIKYHDIYQCQDCQHQEIMRLDDCYRDPFKIVVNDTSFFPNFRLYEQCKNCGGAKRNFPLKYTKDIEVRGEFDLDFFKRSKEASDFDKKIAYEVVSYSNYLTSPKGKYHQYLESKEWKEKRKLVFERDKNLCQSCKSAPAFHVHHLHYNNIFRENLEDLLSVCAACHNKIHYEELLQKIENLRNFK